jgi:DNA/RNA endonuclease YhcR with UshA esterase domain
VGAAMITDEKLRKICLVFIIIGLVGMVLFSQYSTPTAKRINEIGEEHVGKSIQVSGKISSISVNEGNIFIDMSEGSDTITIIMFERTARTQKESYNLSENQSITVFGKVSLYKEELEIVADKISIF